MSQRESVRSRYDAKKCDAGTAAELIHSDSSFYVNGGSGFPCDVVEAVTERARDLQNVRLGHPMRRASRDLSPDYMDPEFAGHIFHVSDFSFDPMIRDAINDGRATYRPNIPTETARFLPGGTDVLSMAAAPMDKNGWFSMGAFGGWAIDFVPGAKKVILEVNPNQPRVHGDCWLHIDQVDAVVEADYPLIAQSHSSSGKEVQASDTERAIAANIIQLIDDGSTLQFGGGVMPQIVAEGLMDSNLRHLGIHTEALSDWVIPLLEEGIVDNSMKSRDRGRTVCAMSLGTPAFYDFLNDNPGIAMRSIAAVNEPSVNSSNFRQVSINATLAMDFSGQCTSETLGRRHYSGTGGQWEFNRSGYLSGGKGIIALPSTAKGGTVSRITPYLAEGSAVSITRNDIDWVVTEYGAVRLKGQDMAQRAQLLIGIAHPDFRDELSGAAREAGLL